MWILLSIRIKTKFFHYSAVYENKIWNRARIYSSFRILDAIFLRSRLVKWYWFRITAVLKGSGSKVLKINEPLVPIWTLSETVFRFAVSMVGMLNHLKNGDGDWDDWRQGECVLPALVGWFFNFYKCFCWGLLYNGNGFNSVSVRTFLCQVKGETFIRGSILLNMYYSG